MMAMRVPAAVAPRGLRRLFCKTAYSYIIASDKLEVGQMVMNCGATGAVPVSEKAEPSTNLFVSGLSKRTTSEKLHEAFSKFGEVVYARVVTDRVSGNSKGFGFVEYATLQDAAKGIEGMDGKFLDGWVMFAEYARPRPLRENMSPPPYGRQ